ncbi:putative TIM-barrel fold metal-dependent hydrolase [Rhodococcus sp. 27YEA15]|uniref:amidohydrolase family protein n=1 Tax=Rhodococcus sp. 27YEA15 TaxID=3156259 RepID=UPI003C7BD7CB
MDKIMIISSDGHATGRVDDYREYLDPEFREEYDDYCVEFKKQPRYAFDPEVFKLRADLDVVEEWDREVNEAGVMEGKWDMDVRLAEMDKHGVAADIIFPDFGKPFELYSATQGAKEGAKPLDFKHKQASDRAYNRWLVDFTSPAPERFANIAMIEFDDVDAAIADMHWAKEQGFKGVLCPMFETSAPLFDKKFDPVWSTMEDLGLILNSHGGVSSTNRSGERDISADAMPHPAMILPIMARHIEFFTHEILDQLIFCGVFERHPNLKVVFTEQGSAWVRPKLAGADYTWKGSYVRSDLRDVVKHSPTEYFERQCWIGSSLLSRHEVAIRHDIGIDKMMIGTDFPHLEGMWHPSVTEYLRATFGVNHVPEDEARQMMGTTAAKVFDFDVEKLAPLVERIGPTADVVLSEPGRDLYPRGDVHKPAAGALV